MTAHIDPDESQHLHAAWLVASGRAPYRDFWENHTPLFYYLLAPLTSLFADRPAVYTAGRAMMVLLAIPTLVLIYRLARRLGSRVAALAVLLLMVQSRFAEYTTQVRPDVPALIAWLATLVALVRWREDGRSTWLWVTGFALGVYAALTPKAVYGAVGVAVLILVAGPGERRGFLRSINAFTSLVAAASIPLLGLLSWLLMTGGPGALAGFAADAVIGNLRYPDFTRQLPDSDEGLIIYALAVIGAVLIIRRDGRRVLLSPLHGPLLLTAGVITAFLACPRTPAVYRYTWLPVLVVAAVYASVALIAGIDYARTRRSPLSRIAAAVVLVLITAIPVSASVVNLRRDRHKNTRQMARMRAELVYACPGEPVLDGTASAVFRPTAYHFHVLVQGLRSWIAAGVLSKQRVLEELYQARAPVADPDRRLHALGGDVDAFLATYYGAGPNALRLAGTTIPLPKGSTSGSRLVTLLIGGAYDLTGGNGVAITIDGAPVHDGLVSLEAGKHELAWQGSGGTISLLIAPCHERRGYVRPVPS
jgi:4-amino-4-deoxy-L-arabinose transferase-like glycosyltransferase